ncbi:DUF4031 domain-containing protein [Leucobacter luti]|uniref:DUF4031 domain-containing protein n=1 Tax=Leucobacter luti TaxID=340320 RepID=UPI003D01D2ED
MAILIDPPAWPAHGTLWSHLVSDASYEELHDFAARLGVPRRSFDLDHYDVPSRLFERAVALGARPVSGKDVVHGLRASGLRVRTAERAALRPVRRRQFLVAEWGGLGTRLGIGIGSGIRSGSGIRNGIRSDSDAPGSAWRELGDELITRWNEPHRNYHDERHLEDVLLSLDHLAVRGERLSKETLLAAWFHDAVYRGTASDEADSAALAAAALGRAGLAPGLRDTVGALIEATAPGRAVRDPDPALAQLLDADLGIFAAPQRRYDEYASAVRGEYAHVPDQEFALRRSEILGAYLARPSIYLTATARELWERAARANVERELAALAAVARG